MLLVEHAGDESPVRASAIVVRHDPTRCDGEIEITSISRRDKLAEEGHVEPFVADALVNLWETMRANWHESRDADDRPTALDITRMGVDESGPAALWLIPGDVLDLNIEDLVESDFREPLAARPSAACQAEPFQHIAHISDGRESLALRRWMTVHAPRLLEILGLSAGWWCGIELSRSAILSDSIDGDIDLIAGPIESDLTPEDWERRIRDEANQRPLYVPRSAISESAVRKACIEGHIVWPPRMDQVVGCEVKVTLYDRRRKRRWRRTHTGEAKEVTGQVRILIRRGFNRVAFLHLAVASPGRDVGAWPWAVAGLDAESARRSFPRVFDPDTVPECGYLIAALGAVPHAPEHYSGAGGSPVVLRDAEQRTLPLDSAERAWRNLLRSHLGELPRPRNLRTFVLQCKNCRGWFLSLDTLSRRCSDCQSLPAS